MPIFRLLYPIFTPPTTISGRLWTIEERSLRVGCLRLRQVNGLESIGLRSEGKRQKRHLSHERVHTELFKTLSPRKGSKRGLMGKSNPRPFFETELCKSLCKNGFGRIVSQKTFVFGLWAMIPRRCCLPLRVLRDH